MKIRLLIIFAFAFSLMACENQENEFDDFGSTSVYFPFQTPARTLILGEYDLGFNDNDNNGRFEIGVTMSGVYKNEINRKVYFELAPELIDPTLLGVADVNVKILPSSYYTIEQESPVTIPTGSTKGRIPVQLEDAFFDDPLSFAGDNEVNYVIPLKITDFEQLDSLLTGVPLVDNPMRVKADDWATQPKDYTLFGIKFMNKYEGMYLRRGEDKFVGTYKVYTAATGITETTNIDNSSVYHNEFVVKDEVTKVTTTGKSKAAVANLVRRDTISSTRTVSIDMSFNDSEECTITNVVGDRHSVTGSGKRLIDGDTWGGEDRDVIYLEYQYRDLDTIYTRNFLNNITKIEYVDFQHTVKDTLVIRDRDVKFEEFTVELIDF